MCSFIHLFFVVAAVVVFETLVLRWIVYIVPRLTALTRERASTETDGSVAAKGSAAVNGLATLAPEEFQNQEAHG